MGRCDAALDRAGRRAQELALPAAYALHAAAAAASLFALLFPNQGHALSAMFFLLGSFEEVVRLEEQEKKPGVDARAQLEARAVAYFAHLALIASACNAILSTSVDASVGPNALYLTFVVLALAGYLGLSVFGTWAWSASRLPPQPARSPRDDVVRAVLRLGAPCGVAACCALADADPRATPILAAYAYARFRGRLASRWWWLALGFGLAAAALAIVAEAQAHPGDEAAYLFPLAFFAGWFAEWLANALDGLPRRDNVRKG